MTITEGESQKLQEMNVTEMKQFVQRDLRDLQNQSKAIAIHIGASEAIQAAKVRNLIDRVKQHYLTTNFATKYCWLNLYDDICTGFD